MKDQNSTILAHLKSGKTITAAQAVQRYGIYRLSARIYDLRESGEEITTQWVEGTARNGNPCRFKLYTLAKKDQL